MASKKTTTKKTQAAKPKPPKPPSSAKAMLAAVSGNSSETVPRSNVGAACQAAVTMENATTVTATATDASAAMFTVSWST